MNVSAGIVGLPNVGKSTLFNTLTNLNVEAANYPFVTILPNVGVVKVPDVRLDNLVSLIQPKSVVAATCSFTDIAGLVKGASKGEGLGNQFLANIREVDAICHVIRCFSDPNITHVMSDIDPIRDCEIIKTELVLADLDVVTKKLPKIISGVRANKPEAIIEQNTVNKIIKTLNENKFINFNDYDEKEIVFVKQYNLLTAKPTLYVANINENDITNPEKNQNYLSLKKYIGNEAQIIPLAIAIENEISKLPDEDKKIFLNDLGIEKPGVEKFINSAYDLLGIKTFFTFGKDEVKA
jgi:GTP-binding protein YchF